ncbi:MAG: ricin-type beta-trefoil lectin domain protein [Rickettsiales bacterium]|nr:ricin-type beta-trefoil lectin domain protein [Rickettsiales bacterium]
MKKYFLIIFLIFTFNSKLFAIIDESVSYRCDEVFYIDSTCYPADATLDKNGNCKCPSGGCQKCPQIKTQSGEIKKDYYCYYPVNVLSVIAREKNRFPISAKVSLLYEEFGHDNSCGPYDVRSVNCASISVVTGAATAGAAGVASVVAGPVGTFSAVAAGAIFTIIECTQSPTDGFVRETIIDPIRFDYKLNDYLHKDKTGEYEEFDSVYASPAKVFGPSDYYAVMPRLEYVINEEGEKDKIIRFYITQRDKLDSAHYVWNLESTSGHHNYFNINESGFSKIKPSQSVFYQQLLSSGNTVEYDEPAFHGKFWKPMEHCGFYDRGDFKDKEGTDSAGWSLIESYVFTDNPSEHPDFEDKSSDELRGLFNMGDSGYNYHKDVGIKCYNNPYIAGLFAKKYSDEVTAIPIEYEEKTFPKPYAGLRLPPPISEPFFPRTIGIDKRDVYFQPEEPSFMWEIVSGTENNFLNPKALIKINAGKDDEHIKEIGLNEIYNYKYEDYYDLQFYAQTEKNQNVNETPELCVYMCFTYDKGSSKYCSVDIASSVVSGEHNLASYVNTVQKTLRDNAKDLFNLPLNKTDKCFKMADFNIDEAGSSIMVSSLGIGSTYDTPKMAIRMKERNINSLNSVINLYEKYEIENSLTGNEMIFRDAIKNSNSGIVLRPELMTIKQEINIDIGTKYCQYYYPKTSEIVQKEITIGDYIQSSSNNVNNYTKECILHNDPSYLDPKFYNHMCLHNAFNQKYSSAGQFGNIAYSNSLTSHADADKLLFMPNDTANNEKLENNPLKQMPFFANIPGKINNHFKDDYKLRRADGDNYYTYFTNDTPYGAESDTKGHNLCSILPRKILNLSYNMHKETYSFNEATTQGFSSINPIYDIKISYRDPRIVNSNNQLVDGNLNNNVDLFGFSFSVDANILKNRHSFYDGSVDLANNSIFSLISPGLQPENTIDARQSSPSKPNSRSSGVDKESVIIHKKFDYYHDLKIEMENIVDYGANNQKLCLYYRLKDYEACDCFNKYTDYSQIKSCYENCNQWGVKTPFSNACHNYQNCPATDTNINNDGVARYSTIPSTIPYTLQVSGTCPPGSNTVKTPISRCDQYGNWHYLQGHCVPGCPAKYSTQRLRYASDGSYHYHGRNGNDDHNNQRFYFAASTADYTEAGNQDSTIDKEHRATTYCDYKYTGTITARDVCKANNAGWNNNITRVTDSCRRIQCPAQNLTFSKGGKTYSYNMPSNINSESEVTYNCSNFTASGGTPLSGTYKIRCQNVGNTSKSRESRQSDFALRVKSNGCARKCFGKADIDVGGSKYYSNDNVESFITSGGMSSGQDSRQLCDNFESMSLNTERIALVKCNDGTLTTDYDSNCKRTCDASNYNYKPSGWVKSININAGTLHTWGDNAVIKCKDRNDLNHDSPLTSSDNDNNITLSCYDGAITATNNGCELLKLTGDIFSMLKSGNGNCLDWECTSNGCAVKAYNCAARGNRQFYRHGTNQIKDVYSQKCMDLEGNDYNGDVKIHSCHSTSHSDYENQKWYYDDQNRFITNTDNGTYQCLTDMGYNEQVYVRDCTGNANQKWYQY